MNQEPITTTTRLPQQEEAGRVMPGDYVRTHTDLTVEEWRLVEAVTEPRGWEGGVGLVLEGGKYLLRPATDTVTVLRVAS